MRGEKFHWCPNGCGKSVYYILQNRHNNKKEWYCDRCEQHFIKKQIEEMY